MQSRLLMHVNPINYAILVFQNQINIFDIPCLVLLKIFETYPKAKSRVHISNYLLLFKQTDLRKFLWKIEIKKILTRLKYFCNYNNTFLRMLWLFRISRCIWHNYMRSYYFDLDKPKNIYFLLVCLYSRPMDTRRKRLRLRNFPFA